MRIAHVLQLATSTPIVALERDGALYDVAELERHFGTKLADIPGVSDFHTRVVALRCAGLHALDDRLLSGDRPASAQLHADTLLWLPPCAVDRAAYVQLGPYARDADLPWYRFGNSRALLGHDATIPFPALEDDPDYELNLAALLAEDLRRATPEDVEKAIAGYTVLNDWTARSLEARSLARGLPLSEAKDFATQLGPVVVTPDELGPVEVLRAQVRVDAETRCCSRIGEWTFSLAESVAYISNQIELRAGDVVGTGRVFGGSAGRRVPYGARVELMIERIGRLTGKPVRGPAPLPWRRR
ncbi:fumarylacetoacetate hydrolase family protein [Sorangium sp. So ce1097]|uniref:fumarylacetoacetate hydrolase family protein n=1 Tax=Sorangium sp. So ce1097 TaxID=3133330 RepID=UPI003F5F8C6C